MFLVSIENGLAALIAGQGEQIGTANGAEADRVAGFPLIGGPGKTGAVL